METHNSSTLAETADADKLKISYEEEFEELKCIGRGNFGAAFLVKLRQAPADEDVYFIAKKIILGQLTDKEKEGAHLEVSTTIHLLRLCCRQDKCILIVHFPAGRSAETT